MEAKESKEQKKAKKRSEKKEKAKNEVIFQLDLKVSIRNEDYILSRDENFNKRKITDKNEWKSQINLSEAEC